MVMLSNKNPPSIMSGPVKDELCAPLRDLRAKGAVASKEYVKIKCANFKTIAFFPSLLMRLIDIHGSL